MCLLFDGVCAGVNGNLLNYFSSVKSKVRRTLRIMKDPHRSRRGWTDSRATCTCMESIHTVMRDCPPPKKAVPDTHLTLPTHKHDATLPSQLC